MFTKIKNALTRRKVSTSIETNGEVINNHRQGKYPKTQKEAVIWHLQDFGSITSMEAFSEYGITRLSHIIYILRRDREMRINSVAMTRINRYGNSVTFSKYTLIENDNSKKQ